MSDYTPTTEEVRGDYANFQLPAEGGDFRDEYADGLAEFDRWLAAHDAAKRAEWEAEQGEVEWEYVVCGYEGLGLYLAPTLEAALEGIAQDQARSETKPKRTIKRRRKAGPWVPVNENGSAER